MKLCILRFMYRYTFLPIVNFYKLYIILIRFYTSFYTNVKIFLLRSSIMLSLSNFYISIDHVQSSRNISCLLLVKGSRNEHKVHIHRIPVSVERNLRQNNFYISVLINLFYFLCYAFIRKIELIDV